jgi:hypothetical protein
MQPRAAFIGFFKQQHRFAQPLASAASKPVQGRVSLRLSAIAQQMSMLSMRRPEYCFGEQKSTIIHLHA